MKLTATIVGSLKTDMRAELRRIERAIPGGVKAAGDGLKGSLRKQVVAAGLGARLSRTWRGRTYANKGHDAASLVWSKAPQIMLAFDRGALIKGKGGRWLAIPTPAAPKRGVGGKRLTPATFPTARHGPLRMVRRSGRCGAAGGRRRAGECEDRTGRPAGQGRRSHQIRELQAGHRHSRDVRAGAAGEVTATPQRRPRGRELDAPVAVADPAAGADNTAKVTPCPARPN